MIPIAAMRLRNSAVAGGGLPLDPWTTNLWGAYSIAKLLTVYGGSALQVVKSGDTTGTPIGFSGSALDTASLATYAGAGSAFVKTWFDQSGSSHDMAQATTANQPRIVNSGTYDGKLVFDGSNDGFGSSTTSGSVPGVTFFIKGNLRSTASLQILLEMSTNFGANNGAFGAYYDNGGGKFNASYVTAAGATANTFVNALSNAVVAFRFQPLLGSPASVAEFVNGSIATATSVTTTGGATSFGPYTYYFAARNLGASLAMALDATTLLIYSAGLSDANIASISAAIA